MSVKQVRRILSTYTADVSGVCSALYELGGMVVIHDPSGCNSTYNTHDEPRWYEKDSLIFITGLSEIDAIMGSDEKFIRDVVSAAETFHPEFIALVQTPIPYMTGVDFEAVAEEIFEKTKIPTWFAPTNGMHSYLYGVEKALVFLTESYIKKSEKPERKEGEPLLVNLLGVTPLDFSVNTTLSSIKRLLVENGFRINACLAMGSDLIEIRKAGRADVNLVLSGAGYEAARKMSEELSIPYVVGVPVKGFADCVLDDLKSSAKDQHNRISYERGQGKAKNEDGPRLIFIGEPVMAQSLGASVYEDSRVKVISPILAPGEILMDFCQVIIPEDEIEEALKDADLIVADPIYQYVSPKKASFISFPHEAFSGRIYRKEIPDPVEKQLISFDITRA